jgi:anti-anti-sigma factor
MLSVSRINNSYTASFQNTNRFNVIIANNVKEKLKSLVQSPENHVTLNFEGISFIDSNGFDALVEVMNIANNHNAYFNINNISDEVMELFQLMKLDSTLNISA